MGLYIINWAQRHGRSKKNVTYWILGGLPGADVIRNTASMLSYTKQNA